jgi:hypothetical protein
MLVLGVWAAGEDDRSIFLLLTLVGIFLVVRGAGHLISAFGLRRLKRDPRGRRSVAREPRDYAPRVSAEIATEAGVGVAPSRQRRVARILLWLGGLALVRARLPALGIDLRAGSPTSGTRSRTSAPGT